jgi:hypothetical protein
VTFRALLTLTLLLAGARAGAQTPPVADAQPPSTPHPAQGDDLEALKKELAELKARLDGGTAEAASRGDVQGVQADLENFKYQYQRDRETKSALSTRNLLLSGVVQARGSWFSEELTGSPGAPVPGNLANSSVNDPLLLDGRNSSFNIPTALLSFSGLLYRDYEQARNLGFSLSVAATPKTSNAGLGTRNTNSFLTILDANTTYQLLPTIENDGNRLAVTFGQQLVPFGLEAFTNEELKPVINNAQFVGKTGFNVRQIGAIARGEFFSQFDFGYNYRQSLLSVAVGVVNGTGPNRDDDNAFKDVVGRVALTVPAEYNSWLRELRIGASAYLGRTTLNTGGSTPTIAGTGLQNRFGADVYYNHFPFGLTYEVVRSVDDVWDGTAAKRVRLNGLGHTVTAFYSFGEQFLRSVKTQAKFDDWWPKTWQPFARYDRWEADLAARGAGNDVFTAGLNVFFAETTKAQLNVNRRVQHVVGAESVASTELLAQVQFGF